MTKLKAPERWILLLTLLFLLATFLWFFKENRERALGYVTVAREQEQVQTQNEKALHPAPGLLENERINLNTASVEDLCRLPGIGAVRAQAILTYRETEGGFVVPEDLLAVSGIGEKTLEKLLPYVTVGS